MGANGSDGMNVNNNQDYFKLNRDINLNQRGYKNFLN